MKNKQKKRTLRNVLMILMIIAIGAGAFFTVNCATANSPENGAPPAIQSEIGNAPPGMENNSEQPPEMPEGENGNSGEQPPEMPEGENGNSGEQPPEMPEGENSSSNEQPPEMPEGENGQQEQMQKPKKQILIYALLAAESLSIAALILYLIMSQFNKKGFKETFKGWKRVVIYLLSTAIISGCLTVAGSAVSKQCMPANPPAQPQMTQGSQTSVEASGAKTVDGKEEALNENYSSASSDESAVLVTNGGNAEISGSAISKTGDSTNTESSEFNGTNAAILVQSNSTATIKNAEITTDAKGANAVFATGENAKIYLTNSKITSTGSSSARGLDSTYGGYIEADNVTITTQGGSCATLATDRGEGTVIAKNSTLETNGSGSPIIYSTGDITVENTTGTANGSQNIVVEGKNSATVKSSTLTASGKGNRNGVDNAGVMLYQSMSGDASEGTGTLTAVDSTLEIQSDSEYYKTAPMFFVTNTDAVINLKNTKLAFGSGILLNAASTSEWGKEGSNGGNVTLNAENQTLKGNITADSISTVSINLTSSDFEGSVNSENSAKEVTLKLDGASKITLTGDCYVTSFENADSTNSNIDFNGFKLYVNGKAIN